MIQLAQVLFMVGVFGLLLVAGHFVATKLKPKSKRRIYTV